MSESAPASANSRLADDRPVGSVHQCPVCCQPKTTFLCSKQTYVIHTCPDCGCDYVCNPPSPEELKAYYSRGNWFEGGEEGGYRNYDEQTSDSLPFVRELLGRFSDKKGSLLDVGCGYGSHLQIAAELGWRCFGVEISEHARTVAMERLCDAATIVATIDDLIPHPFDVILMLDVIEHVSDPFSLFYPLFASGAIQPHTVVIVSTPNGGSLAATSDPVHWTYRHPPSHLTYFKSKTLETFFRALRFTRIDIQGLHPTKSASIESLGLQDYDGLLLEAAGSDFQVFMQERYVPSTWSEIAEYEHFPRYELACRLAPGRKVLDFGCGTGYGSALLATSAASAMGVDIDATALEWARRCHRQSNLSFQQNSDFLAGFEDQSYDLITCFEMIEHVCESDQHRAIQALSRVLRPQGLLLISTPNPEITSLYGANPYHLREMTREEFVDLLKGSFSSVQVVDQYALAGVFFAADDEAYSLESLHGGPIGNAIPLGYVALCSHELQPPLANLGYLDTQRDYISSRLGQERKIVQAQLSAHHSWETAKSLRLELREAQRQLEARIHQISSLGTRGAELERFLHLHQHSRWNRLGQRLRSASFSGSPPVRGVMAVAGAFYRTVLRKPSPLRAGSRALIPAVLEPNDDAHTVRQPQQPSEKRPTVLHAIANFCLGGSSRLVVDLIEALGADFDQPVVTRYIPRPPAYLNLTIYEHAQPSNSAYFQALIDRLQPVFVHVHYWGDCDQDWYEQVFRACEVKGVPVIQNINTPVAPHVSTAVKHDVYVSEYVHQIYGENDEKAMVIYPGSDLSHFAVPDLFSPADDCIGMVYRLENDKLNTRSIEVFIAVARRRPSTRCLIVGDGLLKSVFERMVSQAGVSENFVFPGYVPYKDLPDLYRQMSLFVAPVWKESFGQVSCFAMNMGLPVVGYAVGAIPSIIGDEKLLAHYGDTEGLADLIIELLDDRDRRLEIGLINHAKAQSLYSTEAMLRCYSDLYRSMCAQIV